jgi:MinD superfamily P-loop ATPase
VPVIMPTACLAATTMCSVCVERCPQPGAIVTIGRTPRIVAAACDGCGRCIVACPAPTLAIGLAPRGPS